MTLLFPTKLSVLLVWTALTAPAPQAAAVASEAPVRLAQADTSKAKASTAKAPAAAQPVAAKTEQPAAAKAEKPAAAKGRVSAEARPLVDRLQNFYEGTRDFSARFEQTYTYQARHRSSESSGKVAFKKPGLMRWDYAEPREKSFIVDGKDLWVWTPDDHTAVRSPGFTSDNLSTSITFLWGKGRLEDEFSIELRGKDILVLTPLAPQGGFQKVEFKVDPATGRVLQSTVIDPQGNVNHMVFRDVKLNSGVSADRFEFTPPKGADVQTLRGGGLR